LFWGGPRTSFIVFLQVLEEAVITNLTGYPLGMELGIWTQLHLKGGALSAVNIPASRKRTMK